jgi:hypothetical protein
MTVTVVFDNSVNGLPETLEAEFVAAVNDAVATINTTFENPADITINVGYGEVGGEALSPGALGESLTNYTNSFSYSQVRSALISRGAFGSSSLPTSSPFATPLGVPLSEAAALGFYNPGSTAVGSVGFSSNAPFDYSTADRAVSGEYDFIGVAEHELTEVMGRISLIEDGEYAPLDLFRYAGDGVRQTATGAPSYFSVDGGAANLDNYNNFQTGNSGDLGDWAPSAGDDAFDDNSNIGVENAMTPTDIVEVAALGWGPIFPFTPELGNPPPPAGTTADMIMSDASGDLEIYDIASDAVVFANPLGALSSGVTVLGVGAFNDGDGSDLLLGNTTGSETALYVADVQGNSETGVSLLGSVGNDWHVAGFGQPFGNGSNLMLREASGFFELYDIQNNQIASATAIGNVGIEWNVAGFGRFNGNDTTDMILRDSNNGDFEVYDIVNNSLAGAANLGNVGLEWQVAGFGNFDSNGTTDMMLRNTTTGDFELYGIQNNQVTGARDIGNVGLDWQVAGFASSTGAGASNMVLRQASTGDFEVYDIANGQLQAAHALGNVGNNFQVVGFGNDPIDNATAQFIQAMASFTSSSPATTTPNLTIEQEHQVLIANPNVAHGASSTLN